MGFIHRNLLNRKVNGARDNNLDGGDFKHRIVVVKFLLSSAFH